MVSGSFDFIMSALLIIFLLSYCILFLLFLLPDDQLLLRENCGNLHEIISVCILVNFSRMI